MRFATCLVPLFFLLLTIPNGHSQSLGDLMGQLAEDIGEVIIEDETFRQEWSFDEEQPYRVTFRKEEIDKKGRSTEYLYQFNLADLNDRLVNRETSRNQMFVSLRTQGLLPAIKHFEDGEQKNYEEEIEVMVEGPDAADALIETFRAAIPLAKEKDEARIVPQDYASALDKVVGMVKNVPINDDLHEQTLRPVEGELPILEMEVREPRGKDVELTVSRFNLADINEPVNFEVKGDEVLVELRARGNLKYIQQTVDSEPDNYENSLDILMEDVEQARDMTKLLNFIIPEATDRLKSALPEAEPSMDAVQTFSDMVREVTVGETTFQQSLKPDCETEFAFTETDDRGSTNYVFRFNLGDMNGRQAQIEVKGKTVGVTLPAKGKARLISEEKDSEFDGYVDEVHIEADGLENARKMEHLLPAATEWCEENLVRLAPEGSLTEKLDWAAEQIAAFRGSDGETQQSLRWESDAPCDLTYELNDGKSTDAYEFRMEDLGANKIAMDVSSRSLEIELGTQKDEDLIKYYRDGEMKKFTNAFSIELGSISIARDLLAVFREGVEACRE